MLEGMESVLSYVEIIRSLYHIDIIRQNFRTLRHACTAATSIGPCNTCQIKDLFGRLSTSMRSSVINPVQLTNLISKTHLISKASNTNNNAHAALYSAVLSLLPRDLGLRPVYSLTKVCLTCNTCSHSETVEKLSHKIESVDPIVPSFEFGIKSSLDSNEFCDKPDCFGSLRIFRVLKKIPNLLTFEFESMSTRQLPLHLKPCLIFESPASTELTLTCLTLYHPPATLFYHTRLKVWIHLDSTSVTPIHSYAQVQALALRVRLAFYTKLELPPPHLEPRMSLAAPLTSPAPTPTPSQTTLQESRIYENWPLDTDSGQGSEVNSSLSSEPLHAQQQEVSETKYATIKRKKKKTTPAPLSVSVPDLRHVFDGTKKVSFDCQVTLVDESVEEYLPHPILQRLLAQMNL